MDTADWATSGLAALTGRPDGPPDGSRAAVLARAREVAVQLNASCGVVVDTAELLTGRAAMLGLTRRGRISAGGATRLIKARDGWCALTLSRAADIAAVPALLEADDAAEYWPAIERWAPDRDAADIAERARLLGLPVGELGETRSAPPVVTMLGERAEHRGYAGLLVADLSSMWAGPLCGQLLARAGATVVKVESHARPDGTRSGDRRFFDWMNSGKMCYAADFDEPDELRELLANADVVIESSRPAALVRRGLGPADVPARGGRVWLRVTGHGGQGESADWAGFGDDAAVSGGLVGAGPVFCGDAIADPLTGLQAAVEVAESLRRGGGELVEISLAAVAASYAELPTTGVELDEAAPPAVPRDAPRAGDLGADNGRVADLIRERGAAAC
jgi:hypothetical protein